MSPAFVAMKAIDSNRNLMAAAAASVAPPFSFGSLHNSSRAKLMFVFSSPSWNDDVHYIGHFLVRIGRHDESKPDPLSRRRAVSARV